MTRIEVKDFGPIAEGAVDLKPLTVFIGPNNSGKSYMALLVYALSRVGAGSTIPGQWGDIFDKVLTSGIPPEELPDATYSGAAPDAGPPEELLRDELRRCFGAEIQELVRRGDPASDSFSVAVPYELPDMHLQWEVQSHGGELVQAGWEDERNRFKRYFDQKGVAAGVVSYLVEMLFDVILSGLGQPHYLPASRTGILLGHKTLSSLIVGQASLAWVRPMEVPRLTGAVTDLIQAMLLLEPFRKPRGDIKAVVDFIEREITRGKVDVDQSAEYPEIFFEDATGRYRLNQVSSTVSEIAPLVLFLKYVVEPGERVIIEEPESHLDSGHQRHLASAIAMMVNAGLNVLVTTHSDFFVSELNNLILASGVDQEYTKDYDARELLRPEQIGACFFNPGDEGTRVEDIKVTREDGIDVDSFSKVFRDIYDETIRLEHAGT